MKAGRTHASLLTVLVCVMTLSLGVLLKERCPRQQNLTYPPLCYSDIRGLYEVRGLDRGVLPYLDFPKGGSYASPGFFEYPVGTGVVAAATAATVESARAYLRLNVMLLAAIAIVSAIALARLVGPAALRWSAAPILALYAFNNWDLLAVGCVVAGCFAWSRRRWGWAGTWFGLGAAVKLFPVLFLAPLIIERVCSGDRRGAARAAIGGIAAVVVPNAAVALSNRAGWAATYRFHSDRGFDVGSVWSSILPDTTSVHTVNLVTGVVLLASGALILAVGLWRLRRDGAFPFLQVSSALVAAFLLLSKVSSPQYALWLLPSLVLLRIGMGWWVAWNVVGIAVYAVAFGVGLGPYEPEHALSANETAAVVRGVVLAGLVIVFLRADRAERGAVYVPETLPASGRDRPHS